MNLQVTIKQVKADNSTPCYTEPIGSIGFAIENEIRATYLVAYIYKIVMFLENKSENSYFKLLNQDMIYEIYKQLLKIITIDIKIDNKPTIFDVDETIKSERNSESIWIELVNLKKFLCNNLIEYGLISNCYYLINPIAKRICDEHNILIKKLKVLNNNNNGSEIYSNN